MRDKGRVGTKEMRKTAIAMMGKVNRCSRLAVIVERGCARDKKVMRAMMSVKQAEPIVENPSIRNKQSQIF